MGDIQIVRFRSCDSGRVFDEFVTALRAMPCGRIGDVCLAIRTMLEQGSAIVWAEPFATDAWYGTGATWAEPKVNDHRTLFDTHLDLLGAVCPKAGQVVVRFEAVFAPRRTRRLNWSFPDA